MSFARLVGCCLALAALASVTAACDDALYLGPFTVELPAADGSGRAEQLVSLPDLADGVTVVGDHRILLDAAVSSGAREQRTFLVFLADGRELDATAPRLHELRLSLPPGGARELQIPEDVFRAGEISLSVARGESRWKSRASPVTQLLVGVEAELAEGETATLTFTLRARGEP